MGLFGISISCPYCKRDLEDLSYKMKRVDKCPSCGEKICKTGLFYDIMFRDYTIFLGWKKPFTAKDAKKLVIVISLLIIGLILLYNYRSRVEFEEHNYNIIKEGEDIYKVNKQTKKIQYKFQRSVGWVKYK